MHTSRTVLSAWGAAVWVGVTRVTILSSPLAWRTRVPPPELTLVPGPRVASLAPAHEGAWASETTAHGPGETKWERAGEKKGNCGREMKNRTQTQQHWGLEKVTTKIPLQCYSWEQRLLLRHKQIWLPWWSNTVNFGQWFYAYVACWRGQRQIGVSFAMQRCKWPGDVPSHPGLCGAQTETWGPWALPPRWTLRPGTGSDASPPSSSESARDGPPDTPDAPAEADGERTRDREDRGEESRGREREKREEKNRPRGWNYKWGDEEKTLSDKWLLNQALDYKLAQSLANRRLDRHQMYTVCEQLVCGRWKSKVHQVWIVSMVLLMGPLY